MTTTKYVLTENAAKHIHPVIIWAEGLSLEVGDWVWNDGVTFEVVTAHTTVADDEPILAPLAGQDGAAGADGKTILNGSGVPSVGLGTVNDWYIDTATMCIYGPKASTWGTGVSITGAKGFHQGIGAPSSGLGVDGDYYLDSITKTLYGPKSAGAWGSGISIIGPAGANGTQLDEIAWEGEWDSGTNYVSGNGVIKDTIPYICIAESTNNVPPNTTYWIPLSSIIFRQHREVPAETPNGIITEFTFIQPFATGTENIWVNGLLQREGAAYDYVAGPSLGKVYFNAGHEPPLGSYVIGAYDYGATNRTANAVLNGSGAPSDALGIDGDFYLSDAWYIYGPKVSGAWPSGVALPGSNGTNGTDGNTVLYGTAAPTTEGVNGDFYFRTSTSYWYGPKAAGVWPAGTSLVGATGTAGLTILNGASDPTTEGVDGDFFINTTTWKIFGPKATTWPSGVEILGADGSNGLTILNGAVDPTTEGADGDFYINTATSTIFGPKATTWPAGVALIGTNGLTILNGSGAPGSGTGANGDFYIDTTAWDIYGPKTGGAWGSGTSLIGPVGEGNGDVLGPATNADGKIPQWDGLNSKTLKEGLSLVTTVGETGADTALPSEQAVREALTASLAAYVLLNGQAGGQTISGGTGASENLTLSSTAHGTKGKITTADQIESTIVTGTPPIVVASTDVCTNLNAAKVGSKAETEFALLAGRSGGQTITGGTGASENLTLMSTSNGTKGKIVVGGSVIQSTVATGNAPLEVISTTQVANLNASKVGGKAETDFALLNGRSGGQTLIGGTGASEKLTLRGSSNATAGTIETPDQIVSTIAVGTAPIVVTSTTECTNLNAAKVGGKSAANLLKPYKVEISAGAWTVPGTNGAPLDTDTGTYGNMPRHLFDQTTEEFVEGVFRVPDDIDTTGTVTFYSIGYAATASAAKYIQLKLYHSAIGNGESWDAAYASKTSGDKQPSATQDQLDHFSWTETVANLGWAAGDQVRIKLSRIAPSGTNLAADYGITDFVISIPRA